jgi:hypothetical protein
MVFIEKRDIRCVRVSYITAVKMCGEEGCPIVYADYTYIRTYIHSSHTRPKNCSDDSALGLLASVPRDEQLTILHAGGSTGFFPHAILSSDSTRTQQIATVE